jgi:hypothetical protein
VAHRAGIGRRFLKSSNGTCPSCIRPTRPGGRPRTSSPPTSRGFASTRVRSLRRQARWPPALDLQAGFNKELNRQYTYANLLADQDTRVSSHEAMRQEMVQLAAALTAESSFIEPELLKAGESSVTGFVASEPKLKVYGFYLADVFRRAGHTLSDAEEKLLADAGPLAGNPSSLYNILSNADFPFPTVTLSDGKSVKLDQAAYSELRALPNRADRQKVMSAFFTALGSFGRTFGTSMSGEVLKVQFYSKARKYSAGPRVAAGRPQYSDDGLFAPGRWGQQEPARLPSLPEAAQADHEGRSAPLLRSLRTARVVRRFEIHAGRSAEADPGRGRAARH